jgi:putative ABC transport system permease protein
MIPPDLLPGAVTLALDGRVTIFCAAPTLVVGVLFGLATAWQATGISLVQALTSATRTSTGHGGRFRHTLVVTEVATAVLLLCGGGLLLRTLLTIENLDPGYQADAASVLTMNMTLPGSRYPTPESLVRFFDQVQTEVEATPGVRRAGWATMLPLGGSQIGQNPFHIVGDPPAPPDSRPAADYQIVSSSFFETLRIPIVAGRAFNDGDSSASRPVCIVNEAFVRRHLAGRDPIGLGVTLGGLGAASRSAGPVVREIVGVARQIRGKPDEVQDLAQVYIPNSQLPYGEAFLVVSPREGQAEALAPAVRAAVARVDKLQPIRRMVTLEQVADEATARFRFRAVMVVTFAGLALVLATVGVFGVLSYSVQQRTREFGVRIALGATTTQVLGLVMSGAAKLVGAGVVLGLAAALALAQAVSRFLVGVPPRDPVTFTFVTVVLAVTAAIACAVPAFRAARVDPAVTFRSE